MGNDCRHDNKHATATGYQKGPPKWKISLFYKIVQNMKIWDTWILMFWHKPTFETLWNVFVDLVKHV